VSSIRQFVRVSREKIKVLREGCVDDEDREKVCQRRFAASIAVGAKSRTFLTSGGSDGKLRARFYRGNGCAYTHTHTHLISLSLSFRLSLPLSFSPSLSLFHPSFSLKHTHTHTHSLSLQNTHSISPSMSPTRFPLSIKAVSDFERFEKWWQNPPLFPTFFPSVYCFTSAYFVSYFLSVGVLFQIGFLCFHFLYFLQVCV